MRGSAVCTRSAQQYGRTNDPQPIARGLRVCGVCVSVVVPARVITVIYLAVLHIRLNRFARCGVRVCACCGERLCDVRAKVRHAIVARIRRQCVCVVYYCNGGAGVVLPNKGLVGLATIGSASKRHAFIDLWRTHQLHQKHFRENDAYTRVRHTTNIHHLRALSKRAERA